MFHQNFLSEKQNISQEFNKPMDKPMDNFDRMSEIPSFEEPNEENIFFDKDGNYKGEASKKTIKERQRLLYLQYKTKPLPKTVKRFGLPDDFLDNWEYKRREFHRN